ncbi:uncharacterized protein EI90DRAFT_1407203 [Cantharellus anzutake]|uniref:uncharacterized protein n=1 Tax=Cantharellus anzutake TaxID=1750568 RepID=UPI0019035A3D|nr:uncharacterized protein EI90DRAFT_1407203 [Cantharellus anzutake]KAF8329515.1 hypothetical protein EI90DRAFT_1407203 [Cantharellus anzutake]
MSSSHFLARSQGFWASNTKHHMAGQGFATSSSDTDTERFTVGDGERISTPCLGPCAQTPSQQSPRCHAPDSCPDPHPHPASRLSHLQHFHPVYSHPFPLLAPTLPKGPIDWHLCDPSNTRFECGRIKVPLNYLNESDGRKVELAIGRYLSVNPKRMGSVFVNPGGPGGSGLSFLYRAGPQLSQMLDGAYDIVSWDPRGVNGSLPNALCHTSKQAQDIYNLQFSRPLEFNNLTAEAADPLPSEDISILKHQFRELIRIGLRSLLPLRNRLSRSRPRTSILTHRRTFFTGQLRWVFVWN